MTSRDDHTSTTSAAAFVAALHATPEPHDTPTRQELKRQERDRNPLAGPGYNGPCVVCGEPASVRTSAVKLGPLHAECERRRDWRRRRREDSWRREQRRKAAA